MLLKICALLMLSSLSFAREADPEVVPQVDFQKYAGVWYDIAHYKNFFQKDCIRSTAEYQVLSADSVSVDNVCLKTDGTHGGIQGVARAGDLSAPAKLRVRFNFFLRGDYWIVALDPNYQWAVVSGPAKKSLFILARKAPMDSVLLQGLLGDLRQKGFDVDGLVMDQY